MATRIDGSVENVHNGVPDFLAGEVCGDDGRDVRVIGPRHDIRTAGMSNDDCVVADARDGVDEGGGVPIRQVGGAVVAFRDEGLEEDETDRWGGVYRLEADGRSGGGIVGDVLDEGAVLSSSGFDRFERWDDVRETAAAGASTDGEGANVVSDVAEAAGRVEAVAEVCGVVAEDADGFGGGDGEGVIGVFEQDGGCSAEGADQGRVVVADIAVGGAIDNELKLRVALW